MSTLGSWVLNLIFPSRCCLCGAVVRWRTSLCASCRKTAPYVLPPVCDLCGRGEDICCCNRRQHAFERCVMPFYYDGDAERGILRLKRDGDTSVTYGFAFEMAEVVRREYGGIAFDAVMPVPMVKADELERGYNVAVLMAKPLAELTGIPYMPRLRKLYHTIPQKQLDALRRSGNLLGAFTVDKPQEIVGKTVLLVDDTITTGATLHECAKMLKIYGAEAVYAVTATGSIKKDSQGEDV